MFKKKTFPILSILAALVWMLISSEETCAGIECGSTLPFVETCNTEFQQQVSTDSGEQTDLLEEATENPKVFKPVSYSFNFGTGGCAGAPGDC